MIKSLLFAALLIFLAGCDSSTESDDTKIGRLTAENESLKNEISQLHVTNGKKAVSEMGYISLTIVVSIIIFVLNNIIWLIIYKRKK